MNVWVAHKLEEELESEQRMRPVFLGVPIGYEGLKSYESIEESSYLGALIVVLIAVGFALGCCCTLVGLYIYRKMHKVDITDEDLIRV